MGAEFNILMTHCREAYAVFRQMASRTDDALYEALEQVHALRIKIDTNPTLRAGFDDLRQRHTGGKPTNETLLLVKFAFFPDKLQPGPGHKGDLNKASRYAKLINAALEKGIQPGQFVAFAREQGIQRTAMSSRRTGPSHGRRRPPHHGKRPPNRSSAMSAASGVVTELTPLEAWFYSSAVAERLAAVLQIAKTNPQKISLTVYVNDERVVVTGLVAKAAGEFPEGAIRISHTDSAQNSDANIRRSSPDGAPLRERRGPPIGLHASSLRRVQPVSPRRPRISDGYFWPAWTLAR